MKKFDDCCNPKRESASDFLMSQKYVGRNLEGYKCEVIKTQKGNVQIFWKKEGEKIDLRYYSPSCFTTKIALEALCEWVNNGEVKNAKEAIEKLSKIKGYKITEDVKNLVYEIFTRVIQ